MTTPPRVMLLIDADNVSTDVVEQAISRLHAEYGALHVRRAYGTAENAVKHQKLFKRLSIRPMVNLAAGKNSTDIALAVDALDLVISERPDVVVIASSDSDFAPLVSRIREKGCLVRGIGQKGKVGEETPLIYDDFLEFEHHASRRSAAAAEGLAPAARKTRARRNAKSGEAGEGASGGRAVAEPKAAAKKAPARARTSAKTAAKAAAVAAAAAAPAAPVAAAALPAKRARKTRSAVTPAPEAASPIAAEEAPPAPPAKKAARKPAARKSTAAVPAHAPAPAPEPAPHLPEKVARAFEVLPALAAGERLGVQDAAAVLRKERVFSNADSWPKFFERYREWFELTPHGRPTHVQRRRPG